VLQVRRLRDPAASFAFAEKAVLGTDPAQAMKAAAASIQPQIDQYNKTVKK
jgi:hypothetical protein